MTSSPTKAASAAVISSFFENLAEDSCFVLNSPGEHGQFSSRERASGDGSEESLGNEPVFSPARRANEIAVPSCALKPLASIRLALLKQIRLRRGTGLPAEGRSVALRQGQENPDFAVGEDSVHVEQYEFNFLGPGFGHWGILASGRNRPR